MAKGVPVTHVCVTVTVVKIEKVKVRMSCVGCFPLTSEVRIWSVLLLIVSRSAPNINIHSIRYTKPGFMALFLETWLL